MRIKRSVPARNRHKKVLQSTKGMQHKRRTSYRMGKQAVIRALQYAYRDRRNRKREFRKLWIQRINAAARQEGVSYSAFIKAMNAKNIELDRKVLAQLAVEEPKAFKSVVATSTK